LSWRTEDGLSERTGNRRTGVPVGVPPDGQAAIGLSGPTARCGGVGGSTRALHDARIDTALDIL